jgi:hypothetical protein
VPALFTIWAVQDKRIFAQEEADLSEETGPVEGTVEKTQEVSSRV